MRWLKLDKPTDIRLFLSCAVGAPRPDMPRNSPRLFDNWKPSVGTLLLVERVWETPAQAKAYNKEVGARQRDVILLGDHCREELDVLGYNYVSFKQEFDDPVRYVLAYCDGLVPRVRRAKAVVAKTSRAAGVA